MNPHLSDHPIGAEFSLTWKRTKRRWYVARLHNRGFHGEEWRVDVVMPDGRRGYLMSEGWRWVSEHLETPQARTQEALAKTEV
jgi:hypothetical protein